MIFVKKELNFQEIEKLCSKVHEKPGDELKLPNSLRSVGVFGMEALLLQVIATWIRYDYLGSRILKTHAQDKTPDAFDDLSGRAYGICALSLSDEIHIDSCDENVPKSMALNSAVEKIQKVRSYDFRNSYKGSYISFPYIAAPSTGSELEGVFYNNREVITDYGYYKKVAERALEAVLVSEKTMSILSSEIVSSIAWILMELFVNTHKHARSDENGDFYSKNFRVVDISVQDFRKADRDILSVGNLNFGKAVGTWFSQDQKESLKILDISIVDAGPGYARRWHSCSKEDLLDNSDMEVEAILECFTKHKTTTSNPASGLGLNRTLSEIKKAKGWFRLRTGRTAVEKQFFLDSEPHKISRENIKLMDDFIDGSSLNIVIPLIMEED